MAMPSKQAIKRIFVFAAVLTMHAATTSNAKAACQPFTVYAKDTQGSVTPQGPQGPNGDLIIANGLIYETPTVGGTPIGTFDLNSITTSVNNETERRNVSMEISFDKSFIRRLNKTKILCGATKNFRVANLAPTDDINVMGVGTYPIGGGFPSAPIVFGIATGIGQFVGAEGVDNISYDPTTHFWTHVLTLLPR